MNYRSYHRTRIGVAIGAIWILIGVGLLGWVATSEAAEPFTTAQARAVFHKAEPRGRFHGCARRSAAVLLCRVEVREVATHEWEDPATGEWVEVEKVAYLVPCRVPIRRGGIAWLEATL